MVVLEDFTFLEQNVCLFQQDLSYKELIEQLVATFKDQMGDRHLEVVEKVLERERLVSTAIGGGIAIPHGRLPFLEDFYLAVGVVLGDGVPWEGMDEEDVQIICLIVGPEKEPTRYLSFLSYITSLLKEEEVRQEILFSESKKNIVNIFRSC